MKNKLLFSMLTLCSWILTGCTTHKSLDITPSATIPISTETTPPTVTPAPVLNPSTLSIFASYPLKKVLFKYTVLGGFSDFDKLGLYERTKFAIYSDGQLITSREIDPEMMTKSLSVEEVCSFVERLDKIGFHDIETSQDSDESNPLYDFGLQRQEIYDGLSYSIVLNGDNPKSIGIYEPYKDFLIQPMKQVIDFIENYSPTGLIPYKPDRLVLYVTQGRASIDEKQINVIPWPKDLPPLKTVTNQGFVFLDGEKANNAYKLIMSTRPGVFIEDAEEYSVFADVLFPHESLGTDFVAPDGSTDYNLPIGCKH